MPILLAVGCKRKTEFSHIHVRPREFGLASQVRMSCPGSAQSFSAFRLNLVLLTGFQSLCQLSATVSIEPACVINRAGTEFIRSRNSYRWRSLAEMPVILKVRLLAQVTPGTNSFAPLFSYTHYWFMEGGWVSPIRSFHFRA